MKRCAIYCDNKQEYKALEDKGILFDTEYNPVEDQENRKWQEVTLLQENEINILNKEMENSSY